MISRKHWVVHANGSVTSTRAQQDKENCPPARAPAAASARFPSGVLKVNKETKQPVVKQRQPVLNSKCRQAAAYLKTHCEPWILQLLAKGVLAGRVGCRPSEFKDTDHLYVNIDNKIVVKPTHQLQRRLTPTLTLSDTDEE